MNRILSKSVCRLSSPFLFHMPKLSVTLDPSQGPLNVLIKKELIDRLSTRVYAPGQKLPAEKELAKEFGVSISTVRQAVSALVSERLLVRIQGSGTYVSQYHMTRRRAAFLRIYDKDGRRLNPLRTLKTIEIGEATDQEVALLAMTPGVVNKVLRMVFYAQFSPSDKKTFSTLEMVVPYGPFKKLNSKKYFQNQDFNNYALYSDICGIQVVNLEENVHAIAAPGDVAKTLGVKPGSPLLYIERVSYTYNKIPVEVRRRYMHPDYHYRNYDQG